MKYKNSLNILDFINKVFFKKKVLGIKCDYIIDRFLQKVMKIFLKILKYKI